MSGRTKARGGAKWLPLFLMVFGLSICVFGAETCEDGSNECLDDNLLEGDGIDQEEASHMRKSPFELPVSGGRAVTGTIAATAGDNVYYAFRGIRYAEAPKGRLRFKDPVPSSPWTQLPDAKDGPACPQRANPDSSEDCLWLNVFTPELPTMENPSLEHRHDIAQGLLHEHNFKQHPVIVFLHPGGPNWESGSANSENFGPERLLDHEVLLVTVNYRLGLFGFLAGDGSAGNYGLKDQTVALRWVKENIALFGGDPDRVTVLGHGSGAAAAHLHVLSPQSAGLMQRGMSMSGSALCWWALIPHDKAQTTTAELLSRLGCSDVECLRSKSVDDLLSAQGESDLPSMTLIPPQKSLLDASNYLRFGPVVDGEFLPDDPEQLMRASKFNHVPWNVGLVSGEGNAIAAWLNDQPERSDLELFDKKFESVAPKFFGVPQDPAFLKKLRESYFPDGKAIDSNSLNELEDLFSDSWYTYGVDKAVRIMGETSKAPVYYYFLSNPGEWSFLRHLGSGKSSSLERSMSHGEDLLYLFPLSSVWSALGLEHEESNDDKKFRTLFLEMIADFAEHGQPTHNEWTRHDHHHQYWRHFKPSTDEYLDLAEDSVRMRKNLLEGRLKFWYAANGEDKDQTWTRKTEL